MLPLFFLTVSRKKIKATFNVVFYMSVLSTDILVLNETSNDANDMFVTFHTIKLNVFYVNYY